MALKTLGNTAKALRQESRTVVLDLIRGIPRPSSERESEIFAQLDDVGFAVIPHYYPAEACKAIADEIDSLLERYASTVWIDAAQSDYRIFAADRVSPLIAPYYADQFISGIVRGYERTNQINGFTLAAKLVYRDNNPGSGGGWHRDRADRRQIKAIMYLCDVGPDLGPFQYMEHSHRPAEILKALATEKFEHNQTRFTDEQVERLIARDPKKLHTLTGQAGTLVLVDTRGIHRGMPMKKNSGNRYALTNYYWADQPIPDHILDILVDRQVPKNLT